MTTETKTETIETLQARLDELRLFQSRHAIRVSRITAAMRAKGADTAALSVELSLQNEKMEKALGARNRVEAKMRELKQARHEAEKARDNVRQLVAAMLANPESVENDHAALVWDAARVEQLIQSLNFAE